MNTVEELWAKSEDAYAVYLKIGGEVVGQFTATSTEILDSWQDYVKAHYAYRKARAADFVKSMHGNASGDFSHEAIS